MTRSAQQRQTGLRQQPFVLLMLVLLFCSAMVSRLVWMQSEGSRFRELADENRIRLVPRSPIRGRLLDRKGRVLATSKLTYSLTSSRVWSAMLIGLIFVIAGQVANLIQICWISAGQRSGSGWLPHYVGPDRQPEQVLRPGTGPG